MNSNYYETFDIEGSEKRPMAADITIPNKKHPVPIIIFCHGFKGFKNWGFFDWFAQQCAIEGIAVLKFNFAFNGTTPEHPNEFVDPEAFGQNNYSKELNDLDLVIHWLEKSSFAPKIDLRQIWLVGHSRGAAICLIKASDDKRIKKVVTWASPSDFESGFRGETIEQWEKEGLVHVKNGRTGETYPLYKQFYDDYQKNKEKLDILKACLIFDKPLLIIHGDTDETVPFENAVVIYETVEHSILIKVEKGNHTFGAKHPFDETTDLTDMLEELAENTIEFLKEDLHGKVQF